MKRPAFYFLFFLTIGIIAGRYANDFWHIALFVVAAVFAALAVLKIYGFKWVVYLPAVAIIGYIVCHNAAISPDKEVDKLIDENIRVSGNVQSILYRNNDGGNCFVLEGRVFKDASDIIDSKVKIRVYSDEMVYPGDMLVVEGKLLGLEPKTNPSDFDRKGYLLARGQHYIMYADSIMYGGRHFSLMPFVQGIKEKACNILYSSMPEKEAGLMCGMLLGENANIDDNISRLYKRTGIYHMIAISGLHITLLGGVLLKLFSRFGRGMGTVAVMLLLGCYCILTGCSVSVVRAVLMFYIMLIGRLLFYEYDLMSSAGVAALILLLFRPYFLFDAGFQLSFSAVFAIGAMMDITAKLKKCKKAAETFGINVAVDLVTKPIAMYHFYYINPWSIAANLLLVPVMTISIILGFIIIITGFINLEVARVIAIPVRVILFSVEGWCNLFTNLPMSYIVTGRPVLYLLAAYGIFIVICYNSIMLDKLKAVAIGAVALCSLLSVKTIYSSVYGNGTSVAFLNVGQGDCAVGIGDNYCFIVDGGGKGAGTDRLLPYLMYNGISKVNCVFISHTDSDHIQGIIEVIGQTEIEKIYLPAVCTENKNYFKLKELAKEYKVDIITLHSGEVIGFNERDRMECIYPYDNTAGGDNDCSMVSKFISYESSILFTGDIEASAEKIICGSGADISANVLKLSHHGANNGNTKAFVEKVNPDTAIASAQKSVYGHPGKKVLDMLKELDITCYVTQYSGCIRLEFTKDGIYVIPYMED